MNSLCTLIIFVLLVGYWRCWRKQIVISLRDECHVHAVFSLLVSMGLVVGMAWFTGLTQIMTFTCFILLTPAIAFIVYGEDEF